MTIGICRFDDFDEHIREDGLLDNCAMWDAVRLLFPLHFSLFRSVGHCLTVEANTERLFSFAGRISDPNMTPATLSKYAFISKNSQLLPSMTQIKEAYSKKYKSWALPTEVRLGSVGLYPCPVTPES
jgi:hypothetical protein